MSTLPLSGQKRPRSADTGPIAAAGLPQALAIQQLPRDKFEITPVSATIQSYVQAKVLQLIYAGRCEGSFAKLTRQLMQQFAPSRAQTKAGVRRKSYQALWPRP